MVSELEKRPSLESAQFHYEQAVLKAEKILEENRDRLSNIRPDNFYTLTLDLAQKLIEKDLQKFETSRPLTSFSTFDTIRNLEIVTAIEDARDIAYETLDHQFRHICRLEGTDPESNEARRALKETKSLAEELLRIEERAKAA